MDFSEFEESILSIVPKNDRYGASKQLHLKNWCKAYHKLLGFADKSKSISFFLDVLLDEECWEETDTIHRIKLDRRIAAKKIVQPLSPKGTSTPLDKSLRYKIACKCCLEEDAAALFQHYKRVISKPGSKTDIKMVLQFIEREFSFDPMMNFWSYIIGGCISELLSGTKNPYEYGLKCALESYDSYVEAIEFFWNKIKSLPDDELSDQQKNEIFMRSTITTTRLRFYKTPEVFEFCFSQISPKYYRDLIKCDFEANDVFISLTTLRDNFSFHLYQKLFDCFRPDDIGELDFYRQLTLLAVEEYPEYYEKEAVKLFMHMWMKEGFDQHRDIVLMNEMMDDCYRGNLLVSFVKKNYMEPVWSIMDKANRRGIKSFMKSVKATYIRQALEERGDENSLNKFLSYKPAIERYEILINSDSDSDLSDSNIEHLAKKLKVDELFHM